MHIGILSAPGSWYLKDLARAARQRGHRAVPLAFSQLYSVIAATGSDVHCGETPWSALQAVIVRSMPPGSLEQVVCRMDMLGRFEAAGGQVLNPARCLEVSIDKYLTTARLSAAGLPTPLTIVCQTVEDAMAAFQHLDRDVVVKPLFGGEGRGITRVTDQDVAVRVFKALVQVGAVLYLQRYVPHRGFDIRVLVVGDRMFAIRRLNDTDWRTNVSRGGRTETHELTEEQRHLARGAAKAVAARLAGVDLLPGADGRTWVLEVNAVPGWRALCQTVGEDIAVHVIQLVEGVEREGLEGQVLRR